MTSFSKYILVISICLLALYPNHRVVINAQDLDYTWKNVAIGGGGFVSGIVTSPLEKGLMYCRTDVGGAYRWDTLNNSWIPLLDWTSIDETSYQGVESIAIDPHNPDVVYFGVGTSYFNGGKSAILRSTNRGKTISVIDVTSQFKMHGNRMGRNSGEKIAIDPKSSSIVFYGSSAAGLFKSTDSAKTWTKVPNFDTKTPNENGISFVLFANADAPTDTFTQTVIVGISRMNSTPNLYKSTDGGATFTAITGCPNDLMPQRAVLNSDSTVLITYGNGAGPYGTATEPMDKGKVLKYNLVENTFTDISPVGFGRAFSGVTVDIANPKRILVSSISTYQSQGKAWGDQFFLSNDGGKSWTNIISRGFQLDANGISWLKPEQSIHWAACMVFDPFNSKKAFVVSGNGIFTCEDVDATPAVWKFTVKGLEETVPFDLITLPQGPIVSVIADYDGFLNSKADEYGPQLAPAMGSTQGLTYAALQPNILMRSGSKLFFSLDGGKSWAQSKSAMGTQGYLAISADGKTFIHSPSDVKNVFYSTDKGATWNKSQGIAISGQPVADPVNSSKFYIYNGNGNVYTSNDGGLNFVKSGYAGGGASQHMRTVPGKEGHLWIALYSGGLKRAVDGGVSFTKIANVSACSAVGIGKAKTGSSYHTLFIWGTVNGITGVFRSTDEAASWTRINDNEHEYGGPGNGQFVVGDLNIFGRVYMSTVGRGIVYGSPTFDCNGDSLGSAYIDDCDVCVEGKTGKTACINDCNGVLGGDARYDACGICSGGDTDKVPNTDPTKCKIDCNGDVFGTAVKDACGICTGGNTGITPCFTGVYKSKVSNLFQYSPNPFENQLTLKMINQSVYKVYNVFGEVLETGQNSGIMQIGQKLNSGIYFLEVSGTSKKQTVKICKL